MELNSEIIDIAKKELRDLGIVVEEYIKSKTPNTPSGFLSVFPGLMKRSKSKEDNLDVLTGSVFGSSLHKVPSVDDPRYGRIPKFLYNAVEFLKNHILAEGVFRKAGSTVRQKELRARVEADEELVSADLHDVACILKQFLRELPEPLLTFDLHDLFLACMGNLPASNQENNITCENSLNSVAMKSSSQALSQANRALLLVCLLLPPVSLSTLRYLLEFLHLIQSHSDRNKMDAYNLAVCLAPNVLYSKDITHPSATLCAAGPNKGELQLETQVIESLIRNAAHLQPLIQDLSSRCQVLRTPHNTDIPVGVRCAGGSEKNKNDNCGCRDEGCNDSECRLDVTEGSVWGDSVMSHERGREAERNKRKKKRSGSLQGFVSNLSNSFTKWRRRARSRHGSGYNDDTGSSEQVTDWLRHLGATGAQNGSVMSDFSHMSYMSFDQTVLGDGVPSAECGMDVAPSGECVERALYATPVVRKRKAQDEAFAVPFSESKRKAILQAMPHQHVSHRGVLQSPFTPCTSKKGGVAWNPNDTPNTHFTSADTSDVEMVFSGSGRSPSSTSHNAQTPRLGRFLLPVARSASVAKMTSNTSQRGGGRAGCSPKSGKRGVGESGARSSFRGFFRRRSGSRDPGTDTTQDGNGLTDEEHGSSVSNSQVKTKAAGLVSGLLKRSARRKRSVSPCNIRAKEISNPMKIVEGTEDLATPRHSARPVLDPQMSLPPRPQRRRILSAGEQEQDDSVSGGTCLKRGRPNTIRAGLPSPVARRDVSWLGNESVSHPVLGLVSNMDVKGVKEGNQNKEDGTERQAKILIDTSPILGNEEDGCVERFVGGKKTRRRVDKDEKSYGESISKTLVDSKPSISEGSGLKSTESEDKINEEGTVRVMMQVGLDETDHNLAFSESMLMEFEEENEGKKLEAIGVSGQSKQGCPDPDMKILSVHANMNTVTDCGVIDGRNLKGKREYEPDMKCSLVDHIQRYGSRRSVRSLDSGLGFCNEDDDVGSQAGFQSSRANLHVLNSPAKVNVDKLQRSKESSSKDVCGVKDDCGISEANNHRQVEDVKSLCLVTEKIIKEEADSEKCERKSEENDIKILTCSDECSGKQILLEALKSNRQSSEAVNISTSLNVSARERNSSFRSHSPSTAMSKRIPILPISTNLLRVSFNAHQRRTRPVVDSENCNRKGLLDGMGTLSRDRTNRVVAAFASCQETGKVVDKVKGGECEDIIEESVIDGMNKKEESDSSKSSNEDTLTTLNATVILNDGNNKIHVEVMPDSQNACKLNIDDFKSSLGTASSTAASDIGSKDLHGKDSITVEHTPCRNEPVCTPRIKSSLLTPAAAQRFRAPAVASDRILTPATRHQDTGNDSSHISHRNMSPCKVSNQLNIGERTAGLRFEDKLKSCDAKNMCLGVTSKFSNLPGSPACKTRNRKGSPFKTAKTEDEAKNLISAPLSIDI